MSDNQEKLSTQTDAPQEVERIRDIIFGTQMRDYEQKFQALQRDLKRSQQEIERLSGQLTEQGSDQGKKLQQLRQEMREADDDVRDELRQSSQQLNTDKVDRLALGELFIELGNHLKSGGLLSDLLKNLE